MLTVPQPFPSTLLWSFIVHISMFKALIVKKIKYLFKLSISEKYSLSFKCFSKM